MPEEIKINATDDALRIAEENNIDITTVKGTGQDGRILKGDVVKAVKELDQAEDEAAPAEDIQVTGTVAEDTEAETEAEEFQVSTKDLIEEFVALPNLAVPRAKKILDKLLSESLK